MTTLALDRVVLNLNLVYQDTRPGDDTIVVGYEFIADCQIVVDNLIAIGAILDSGDKLRLTAMGEILIELIKDRLPWLREFVEGACSL